LALWVVGHHWFYAIENQQLNHFFGYAYFSVDIFFILSGFILFKIYEKISLKNILSFYLKRFLRIFPLHLFSLLALTVIVSYPSFQFEFNIDYLTSIFLLQAFHEINAINNPPSWSISIELICYFLFPFILFASNKGSGKQLIIQTLIVILASVLTQHYYRGETTGLGAVFRGISGFLLGIFASKLSNRLIINNYQSNSVQFLSIFLFLFCIISSGNLGGFYKSKNVIVAEIAVSENESIILEMMKNKAPLIEIAKLMDENDISVSRLSAITGINKTLIQKNYNSLNPDGKFYSIFNLFFIDIIY
jgi:peptidoglycan/LPS O-acetylase OafA/YrhL